MMWSLKQVQAEMNKLMLCGVAWLCLLGGEPAAMSAASPTVTAALDRNVVPLGESVTLSLTFVGGAPQGTPALPNLPNLRATGSVGHSSRINFVNGQMSSQNTFSYTLLPTAVGEVTIPALRVQVGNNVLSTQPLQLKIVPAGTGPDVGQTNQPPVAFLRLVVPKNEVYVGEAFPVDIHLYNQNARDVRTPQLQADGFSLNQGKEPNYSQTQTRVGNQTYNLVVFRLAASAARAGDLSLGPATCDLVVLIPTPRPRTRDPFFDPWSILGGGAQRRQVTLSSDPHPMKVLPLPQVDVPETFTGAVGRYQMSVTATPTNVAVGDPITVRVQISGQGFVDSINLPPQTHWRDFKIYPPSDRVDLSNPLGLAGTKSFEQVVIPQNHEIDALPSLVFSYFDSTERCYRTLSNAPVALTVRHASQASTPLPALTNAQERVGPGADDIIHIKARFDGVMAWQAPLVSRPWFLALQAVPILAWVALLLLRKHRETLAKNPKLQRQKLVSRRIRQGLEELRQQAASQQSEAFFLTAFRLLQEQLGERLDLPASAITESVIDERLRSHNLPETLLRDLHELFQTCNQARFAPQVTGQELANLVPRLEEVLRQLQQLKL